MSLGYRFGRYQDMDGGLSQESVWNENGIQGKKVFWRQEKKGFWEGK